MQKDAEVPTGNEAPAEGATSKGSQPKKQQADISVNIAEKPHKTPLGPPGMLPPTLKLGDRNSTFFETKLDIKKEMEERNKREFDIWGKEIYLNSCKQSNLIPMNIAVRQLPTEALNLAHRVIDAHDLRPLCLSLNTNANIYSLVLDDNAIGLEGAKWLITALKENVAVREVSLAENHLGNAVCTLVAELLAINRNITYVNLAGNSLDDRAGQDIGAILEITFTLKALNLSRNKLSDGAAEEIANSLRYNDSIEDFNMEWNCFMPPGCRMIFNGLKKNLGVRHFRFSHNGTDDTCAVNIAEMLQSNHVMTVLDVSSSRLSNHSASVIIGQGLARNDALEQINLNNNIMTETAILEFLDFVRTSSTCAPFKKLILESVPVRAHTAEMIESFKEENPDGPTIASGPVVSGVAGRKPALLSPARPVEEAMNDRGSRASDRPTTGSFPLERALSNAQTPQPFSRQSSQLIS